MMASKQNKTCKVCGESYYFCPSCSRSASDKYKTMFCSKNCRDIFHTCSRYTVGTIDKAMAKSILSELDLSNRNKFSERIKADLSNILKTKSKFVKKEVTPVEEPIVVEPTFAPVETVIEEQII